MNLSKSTIETLKLLSLPLGILAISVFGFLVIKFYDSSATRIPTNVNSLIYNLEPDEIKQRELMKVKAANDSKGLKKPHGSIEIHILCSDAGALSAGRESELTGILKVDRDIDEVSLVWHLPGSVEQVSGSPKDIFYKLHAGEERRVSIHIQSHSISNEQIHLEATYAQANSKIGNTAQFNTIDQIAIDKVANNQMNSSQSRGTKIWQ